MENDTDLSKLSKEKKFMKMFDPQKDSDEIIYKNSLLEFNNEIKGKKDTNIKELTHDSLLRRMAMEDYSLFPPNNDSILITDDETLIGKEDPEKLYEEEVNYLRSINAINYLTFSPFGDSFFPYKYKNKTSDNEQCVNDETPNEDTGDTNDRENKILNIIDFDYNNYEINNDLLFNISMGFIDMSKLKKENAVSSDEFVPRSERFNNGRKLTNKFVRKKKEEDKKIFEYDVEFKSDLMESILKFVNKNENIEFFKKTINNFYKEYTQLENMNKNIEKNELLLKWDRIFRERQKMYASYLKELEKKEREKRRQQRIQKKNDEKLLREKMKQFEKDEEFKNELKKIRKKGLELQEKNKDKRSSLMDHPKKRMNLYLRYSFLDDNDNLAFIRNRNDSIYNANKINARRRRGQTVYQKMRGSEEERVGWLKSKKDYLFYNL